MRLTDQEILRVLETAEASIRLAKACITPSVPGAEPDQLFIDWQLRRAHAACLYAATEYRIAKS